MLPDPDDESDRDDFDDEFVEIEEKPKSKINNITKKSNDSSKSLKNTVK